MTRKQKILYFLLLHRQGLSVLLFSSGLILFPFFDANPYTLGLTNLVAINVLLVLGLNLFIGFAGQISLGHAAFFGLGAYGSAISTVIFNLPPWLAMVVVGACIAILAFFIAIPILRLSGHYLAMATLGLNYVLHTILLQWDQVTGGPSGFAGIPSLSIGQFYFDTPLRRHYLLWTIVTITIFLCLNLVRTNAGRSLAAVAGDEDAAASLGVNTRLAKVKIFVLSAFLASLAGSFFAHSFTYISPDTFNIFASTQLAIMVVIGGMGSIWGSVFGAGFLTLLPHWIEFFDTYKDLIHGGILVLVLMFLPQGLTTGLMDKIRIFWALRRQNAGH